MRLDTKQNITFALVVSLELVSAGPLLPRDKSQCGLIGYDAGTESFIGVSSITSASACSSECMKYTQCNTFAFGGVTGDCQLYTTTIGQNFVAAEDSPYIFYDRSCIITPSSTSMTSAAASKRTTSSRIITTPSPKTSAFTTTTTIPTQTTSSLSITTLTKITTKASSTTATHRATVGSALRDVTSLTTTKTSSRITSTSMSVKVATTTTRT